MSEFKKMDHSQSYILRLLFFANSAFVVFARLLGILFPHSTTGEIPLMYRLHMDNFSYVYEFVCCALKFCRFDLAEHFLER